MQSLSALLSEFEYPSATLPNMNPTKYVDISGATSIYK